MELIRGFHNLRARHRGCVLTIGNFDGVHRGHQALIARARALADAAAVPLTLLSFEPTPREYFDPAASPGRVSTFRGKVCDIAQQGVDRLLLQRFGKAFAAIEAARFVQELLVGRLGTQTVIVGDDFRFGAGRTGDLALLRRLGAPLGMQAESLATIEIQGRRCSSTALRAALAAPDLALAQDLLGRPYTMRGRVRQGLQLGRKLGMPTTNMFLQRRPALRLGVYAVRAQVFGRVWDGVANIGVRPTLGLTRCLLETHLFEDPGELYGQIVVVEFHRFIRDEQRFDSLELLRERMFEDKREAMAFFASRPA